MSDWLANIDTNLFIFLNGKLANPVFDAVMPIITNDWLLRVVFLIIVVSLAIFGKKQGRIAAVLCVIAVGCSDQMSSHLIKPLVSRLRPCHVVASVHLLINCSQGLSFPSSHAANSFAPAVLMSFFYPKKVWLFLAIAAVVAYSRIVVGVHYPFDVAAGAVVGAICGIVIVVIYRYVNARFIARKHPPQSTA